MAAGKIVSIVRAKHNLLDRIRAADAVSHETSVPLAPANRWEQRHLTKLRRGGVLRHAGDGHYWLDMPRFRRWQKIRYVQVGVAIAVAVATLAELVH